jgi:hypothetical protein
MFRIVCDPSSGSIELYLTEIRSGSLMFVVCLIGVWQRNFWTSGVCIRYDGLRITVLRPSYPTHTPLAQKLRCQTPITVLSPSHRTHTPLVQKLRCQTQITVLSPSYRTHTHTHTNTHTTGSKLHCQTPTKHTTNISEPLRTISVKYSSILPDDGSHTARNMLEWFLILCLLKFLYNVDFNL